jgi:hypothetical protein
MSEHVCSHCGANVRAYKHRLNKGLIKGLICLYKTDGGVSKLADLPLTKNEFNNFQKLGFWGLVEKETVGGERTCRWKITKLGIDFIMSRVTIPVWVETFRRARISEAKEVVGISDLVEVKYKKREEYLDDYSKYL